jgi:hypothetical protein
MFYHSTVLWYLLQPIVAYIIYLAQRSSKLDKLEC